MWTVNRPRQRRRFAGGIHEHAGGVDVDVAAWIPEDSKDLGGCRGDETRHFDACGLVVEIGHRVSMSSGLRRSPPVGGRAESPDPKGPGGVAH
jgi:hypothetical protein